MDPNTRIAEAERWIGIAVKLLTSRDFLGSKTFAIRAKESDPNNPLPDQILAVIETVLAGENRVSPSHNPDWYTVLQLPRLVRDSELITNHYRRLAMLLNPETNRVPYADYAVQLVMEAWSVLSDPTKKWVYDNELALYLQRIEQHNQPPPPQQPPVRVEALRVEVDPQHLAPAENSQFFQPQPSLPMPTVPMWQQQPQENQNYHQHRQPPQNISNNNNNNNQLHQIEFMQPALPPPQPQKHQQPPPQPQKHQQPPPQPQKHQQPPPQPQKHQQPPPQPQNHQQLPPQLQNHQQPPPQPQKHQQPPPQPQKHQQPPPQPQKHQQPPPQPQKHLSSTPQWQIRDLTPAVGGDKDEEVLNGIGGRTGTKPTATTPIMGRVADAAPVAAVLTPARTTPRPAPTPPQLPSVVVPARAVTATNNDAVNISDLSDAGVVHKNNDNNSNADDTATNENNDEAVEEEVESFWTSCPYCFYIYEYQKEYQDRTLRCQNCRRGFHGLQIPNPPIGGDGGGEKDKESSFCSWGVFPLGFSTASWKKHNQIGKSNVASNWVPLSPMFAFPVENVGGNFQWFPSNSGASVGPKNMGRPRVSQPRVYRDDNDDDDFVSDHSDSDSSDRDWQRNPTHEKHNKNKRRGMVGAVVRPRKVNPQGCSYMPIIVLGLTAGTKEVARKKVTSTLPKNQTRKKVKNTGKLDLNVEFNNEGDEHAPRVRAVNGEEDGIENIGFFEGLDEFFSTLPILKPGEGEKADEPS